MTLNDAQANSALDDIQAIVPVRNEAATIALVVRGLKAAGLQRVRVVDNGSTDGSSRIAAEAGAEVACEPIPGYGRACWRGLQQLDEGVDWVFFCDGDGSDDLSDLPEFCRRRSEYDLILGDRRASISGRSAMTPAQNFGNALATFLLGMGWGYWYRDLGPMRLVRRSLLEQMQMQDRGFGWTVEMQARAIELGARIAEIPVAYRPRQGGRSKISGTLTGSVRAGTIILYTLARLYWRKVRDRQRAGGR